MSGSLPERGEHAGPIDDLDAVRIAAALDRLGATIGRPLSIAAETGSTNDDAKRAALAGAPHGATFLADTQRAGRGRGGHTWHSPAGANIYLSIVLRPRVAATAIAPVTLAVGLAVARVVVRAIERDAEPPRDDASPEHCRESKDAKETRCPPPAALRASAPPKSPAPPAQGGERSSDAGGAPGQVSFGRAALKWPNDVFVDGRKIAGVLVEGQLRGENVASLVAGIGLNVKTCAFPDDLARIATSLALAGALDLDRSGIVAALVAEVGAVLRTFEAAHLAPLLPEIRALDFLRGRAVDVGGVRGVGAGIDDAGRILVRDEAGAIHSVASGEVLLVAAPDAVSSSG